MKNYNRNGAARGWTPAAGFLVLFFCAPAASVSQTFTSVVDVLPVNELGAWRSVNWVDYDRDGDLDLFLTRGWSGGQDNVLFRNDGAPLFAFTRMDGLTVSQDHKPSDGSTWADFDNDGFPDLFAVNWYNEHNLLYRNLGGSSFSGLLAEPPGLNNGYSETASWGDYNNDGLVDLYVSNSAGSRVNFLYRNTGGGHFERVLTGAPVTDQHTSRGVNWVDIDGDGDLDLFVANENNEHEDLYRNMLVESGVDTFARVSADTLVTSGGSSWSGSWADYDNDGDQDVYLTNWTAQTGKLFANDGTGSFTLADQGDLSTDPAYGASGAWGDIDNDGDLDLVVTHSYSPGYDRNTLYINKKIETGTATLERVTSGPVVTDSGYNYGVSWGDYDGDGDLDLFVARTKGEVQVNAMYRNAGNSNHWLTMDLTGTASNRSAIGAAIRLTAVINGVPVKQLRVIEGQSGYCGQNLQAHFGLGDAAVIDSIDIRWPSGAREVFTGVAADRHLSVAENDSTPIVTVSPADAFLNLSPLVALTWQRPLYPGPYRLQVSTDSTFSGGIVRDTTVGSDTTVVIPIQQNLVRYFWRVIPERSIHDGMWSATRSFDNQFAVLPRQIEPVDGSAQFPGVIFRWTSSPWATGYHLQYATDSSWAAPEYDDSTLTDTVHVEGGLTPDQEYFWRVRATYADSNGTWTGVFSFDTTPDTFTSITGSAWTLVSLPGKVEDPAASTLYPGAITPVYSYDGGYSSADTLQYGRGYWVKMPLATGLAVAVAHRQTDTIGLSPGWNLIGCSSVPVAVSSIASIPGGITTSGFYAYDGSYHLPDTLTPGRGYWVKADEPGTLLVGEFSAAVPAARLQIRAAAEEPPPPPGNAAAATTGLPGEYHLGPNHPNPFNPSTHITFRLPREERVLLRVYNLLGEVVTTLVDETREAGEHSVEWNIPAGSGAAGSGVYFYRMTAGDFSNMKKMVVMK